MQKLLSFFIIILTLNISIAKAELPQILALVNNTPITLYEFQSRKKMIMVLNNVASPTASAEKQINNLDIIYYISPLYKISDLYISIGLYYKCHIYMYIYMYLHVYVSIYIYPHI